MFYGSLVFYNDFDIILAPHRFSPRAFATAATIVPPRAIYVALLDAAR